jgi:tripartite ATP-independent transporter DctP family solute receptor
MGALAFTALAGPSAAADTVTLKMASVTSLSAKDASVMFKDIVEKSSNGSIKVDVFPDNQLGDDRVVVESTVFGDIDIALSSTSPLATMFPDLYVFDAPYLFLSTEQAYKALDGKGGEMVLDGLAGKGLKGLALWENGFRNFTNSKKEVRLPPDAAAMKIRTMQNDVHIAAWKAFGANPTPMAFTELFTAMQQGTVDGEENPLGIIDGNKFQEVQKYLTLSQHVYTPYIMVMNLDKFNSLTDEQKAVITKASAESTIYQRKRSQELEAEILTRVAAQGMTVSELKPDEKAAWQKVVVDAKIFDIVKSKMEHPELLDELAAK